MKGLLSVAAVLILAACAAAPARQSPALAPSPTVSPSLPTAGTTSPASIAGSSTLQPSSGPRPTNGPIYFTDGNVNRVDDGVLSVMADLVAVDVEWSPDGSQVLHVGGASTGPIYRSNADGTGTVELTQGYHPNWSPDSASIVFLRETPGTTDSETDLYLIRADGSDERRLTTSPEFREIWPTWSPDGTRILFSRWATDGTEDTPSYDPEVATMDVRTGQVEVLGTGQEPAYSPDGTLIAIEQCFGLVVIDGASATQLFDVHASCYAPAWSPDSTQIAYATDDHISVMDISSGAVRELPAFPDAVFVTRVVWSPDGTQVASIVTIPCSTCFEGGQRPVLVVQPASAFGTPRWLADAGGDLEWEPARP